MAAVGKNHVLVLAPLRLDDRLRDAVEHEDPVRPAVLHVLPWDDEHGIGRRVVPPFPVPSQPAHHPIPGTRVQDEQGPPGKPVWQQRQQDPLLDPRDGLGLFLEPISKLLSVRA